MILKIGLRGSIADDYARSGFCNAHEFLVHILRFRPISRVWDGDDVIFCYTHEQNQELPNAIPYVPLEIFN
jgi:hypothetical protein